jgi:HJR/Mrr/RecB family endonuclease
VVVGVEEDEGVTARPDVPNRLARWWRKMEGEAGLRPGLAMVRKSVILERMKWMKITLAAMMLGACVCVVPSANAASEDDLELARVITVEQIDEMAGLTFEIYVCRVLESRGYEVENIRARNDFGVDAIAAKGEDRFAIQIKRSKHPIDRTAISDAAAGKEYYDCNRAMVVTNSRLTKSAKQFAEAIGCRVVERDEFLGWVEEFKKGPADH